MIDFFLEKAYEIENKETLASVLTDKWISENGLNKNMEFIETLIRAANGVTGWSAYSNARKARSNLLDIADNQRKMRMMY